MRNRLKKNSGEVMIESLVVYTITIFLLFFILALFSALYQRWNVQTIANESATRYAQTYRFDNKDVSSGYITKDQLTEVKDYRYVGDSLEISAKNEIILIMNTVVLVWGQNAVANLCSHTRLRM